MSRNGNGSSAHARLREALAAGGPGSKEKGPPVADGILTVTPDTAEAIEFRKRQSTFDSVASSSSYLEDDTGPKPSELYGKFTWKIENFKDLQKRELRSSVFEVGSYKWYILVYPQGCDVSNHLSLFLCVADYDKLLPGWSHFAQFTIAVVNKDPKKSKYSDTLHRFCKKEHDWGWKKFMELNKVLEGFTVNNTLLIKAQVQVIRDRPHAPFRCLDAQYRRELVRVYLTNVATACRKFVDEKRSDLIRLREDSHGFKTFLTNLDFKRRKLLAMEKGDTVLKAIVKRFFNEKEVTSTLVMDALFSGCKQLEEAGRRFDSQKGKKEKPGAVINSEKGQFILVGDMNALLERVASESIPYSREEKTNDLSLRNAQDVDEYSKDYIERDERRLAELGRRAVEMLAVSLIFKELQSAHNEALSLKLQDQLIKEEEEAERLSDERQASRLAIEREKKARKKERRRAKKVEDEAQASDKKKTIEDPSSIENSAQRKVKAQVKAGTIEEQPENLAAQSSSVGIPRSHSSDDSPLKPESAQVSSSRPFQTQNKTMNERSLSKERSDDEASTTSQSNSEERASISAQQYEEHIEYLKGELARATSQLNGSRAELEETRENLRDAELKIKSLESKLASSRAELESTAHNLDCSSGSSRPSTASNYEELVPSGNEVSSSDPRINPPNLTRRESSHAQESVSGDQEPLTSHREGVSKQHNNASKQRAPAWNGISGPAHQDLPPNPQSQLDLQAGRSMSGQLGQIRQPPPPPPPAAQPAGANGHSTLSQRGSGMARQPSAPQPLNGIIQSRSQPGRNSQSSAQGLKRGQDAPNNRPPSKPSNVLNGNAPSFIPGSSLQNGNHVISYRNVAAGLVSNSGSGDLVDTPKLPQVSAVRNSEASSTIPILSKGIQTSSSSLPATPRSGDQHTPLASSIIGSNPSEGNTFSPKSFNRGTNQGQHGSTRFATTPPHQRPNASVGMESPGLDDFAHMGLITDLLE